MRNLMAVAAVLFLTGCQNNDAQAVDRSSESIVWTTPDCEFAVRFPESPEDETKEVPGFGEFRAAGLEIGNSAFRADCSVMPAVFIENVSANPRDALRKLLIENSRRSGVDPVEIEMKQKDDFLVGMARGNKQVDGKQVTYIMAAIFGERTLFSAMIGAPSSEFPMAGQMAFIDSIERKR